MTSTCVWAVWSKGVHTRADVQRRLDRCAWWFLTSAFFVLCYVVLLQHAMLHTILHHITRLRKLYDLCTVFYIIPYHTTHRTKPRIVPYRTMPSYALMQYYAMEYYTILYHTTQHYSILYYTILYYSILYDITRCILYCIVFYNAVLNHTTVSHTILYNIFLCAALYHTILYCTIQNIPSYFEATVFYAIPCYNIPYDMFSATKLVRLCPLTVLDATLSILHDSPRVLQNWYTAGETEMGAPPLPQKMMGADGRRWAPIFFDKFFFL